MYKMTKNQLILPDDFFSHSAANWIKRIAGSLWPILFLGGGLKKIMAKTMKQSQRGQRAFSVRMAVGALYIRVPLFLEHHGTSKTLDISIIR